jgi:hypothetical protein
MHPGADSQNGSAALISGNFFIVLSRNSEHLQPMQVSETCTKKNRKIG